MAECHNALAVFQIKKEDPVKSVILPYARPLPCLCIEVKHSWFNVQCDLFTLVISSTKSIEPFVIFNILHRDGRQWWMPPESRSAPLRTVSHLIAFSRIKFCVLFSFFFFMTSWVIPRHLKKNMTSPACRSRGAVVRNNLRPAGGDAIVGARLSGRSCGFAVSGKRGRRLCGSASRLAECEQRKGTALWNVEVQVVFTCSVFPTVWWSSLELMYVWANNAQD